MKEYIDINRRVNQPTVYITARADFSDILLALQELINCNRGRFVADDYRRLRFLAQQVKEKVYLQKENV